MVKDISGRNFGKSLSTPLLAQKFREKSGYKRFSCGLAQRLAFVCQCFDGGVENKNLVQARSDCQHLGYVALI